MSGRSGVVVLGRAGRSTNILVNALCASIGVDHVVLESPEPRRAFLARRVRRLGLWTVAGQLAFLLSAVPVLRALGRRRVAAIVAETGLDPAPVPPSLVTRVSSVNDAATIELLRDAAPSVVVLSGPRIVASEVLDAVPATFLNLHAGITPAFRGVHGGYWALEQRRPDVCGVTVHEVDAGVDTGAVIAQALVEPTAADSYATYPLLQLAAGLPLLCDAVRAARDGDALATVKGPGPTKVWSHPTLWGYLRRRIRDDVR